MEQKFSKQMRRKIFEDNRDQFFEILLYNRDSFLWDYFQKDYLVMLADHKDSVSYADIEIILKIVPLLLDKNKGTPTSKESII